MNETYLAIVSHDVKSNTLEATWVEISAEGTEKRLKVRNYSSEQKAEFLADTGAEGQKYVDMAQWQ